MNEARYNVPQELDKPFRIIVLTVDEFILIIPQLLFCMFALNAPLTGIVFGAVIYGLLRRLKARAGHSWLFNLAYWYLPLHVFKKTPPSASRHWIA